MLQNKLTAKVDGILIPAYVQRRNGVMLFFDFGTWAAENHDQDAWLTPCHSRLIDAWIALKYITCAWNIATAEQLCIDKIGTQSSIALLQESCNAECIVNCKSSVPAVTGAQSSHASERAHV